MTKDCLPEGLLTKKEAAKWLKISERTLDRERDQGNIAWVPVRGQVRFSMDQLLEYVNRHTVPKRK